MAVHREGRDFSAYLEQYSCSDGSMNISGEGGPYIAVGDVMITTRGGDERWKVAAFERQGRTFHAHVTPVTTHIRAVVEEAVAETLAKAAPGVVVSLFGERR